MTEIDQLLDPADLPVPGLLPARMLNEFAYCPRLFFMEWVEARFTDNDDTIEGRFHHRIVDQPSGGGSLYDDPGISGVRDPVSVRRGYLICYDVRDPKRLRRVHRAMQGWGEWVQYSVFLCDLDRGELVGMRTEIGQLISHREDSVMVVPLGRGGRRSEIVFLGTSVKLPDAGARII